MSSLLQLRSSNPAGTSTLAPGTSTTSQCFVTVFGVPGQLRDPALRALAEVGQIVNVRDVSSGVIDVQFADSTSARAALALNGRVVRPVASELGLAIMGVVPYDSSRIAPTAEGLLPPMAGAQVPAVTEVQQTAPYEFQPTQGIWQRIKHFAFGP